MGVSGRDVAGAELYGRLVRVVHGIAQEGARELRDEGLSPAQYQMLVALAGRPDVQQRELGEMLAVTKGNVSMLAARLETAGLVSRTPAGAAYLVRLTAEGESVVARLRPRHAAFLADQFVGLTDADLGELGRLLDLLENCTP